MKTDQLNQKAIIVFLQAASVAVAKLKQRLRQDYEWAYPDLREIIHIVLDEEEARAWEMTLFPHLLMPDMVEARLAQLNLSPAKAKRPRVFAPQHNQLAFAFCI